MKIEFVSWRDGRPRFSPSPSLRKKGHAGHDLKIQDAGTGALRWMTPGEALDWSHAFAAKLEAERQAARQARARKKAKEAAAASKSLPRVTRGRSYTLGQLLEDFNINGTKRLAPATRRLYSELRKMIEAEAPLAYATEAVAISRPALIGLYEQLLERRGVSMSYHGIQYIRNVYNWAIDREKVSCGNPAARIKVEKPGARIRVITPAEFLHLVATSDRLGMGDIGDMITWGVLGCQRAGDRLAMEQTFIHDGRMELTQQKTGKDVRVRISRHIHARLAARPLGNRKHVIIHSESLDPLAYSTYAQRWRRVRAEAVKTMPKLKGLQDRDFRDTSISWMGLAGCTQFEVMAVSGHGHTDETKVLAHYLELNKSLADKAIEKLDRWLDRELKTLKRKGEGK